MAVKCGHVTKDRWLLWNLFSWEQRKRYILGCSSKTCNDAVREDMGLESLKGRRDRSKLKWWYKVNELGDERYPKLLLHTEWEVKPCRGRQRKTWTRVVNGTVKSRQSRGISQGLQY